MLSHARLIPNHPREYVRREGSSSAYEKQTAMYPAKADEPEADMLFNDYTP
jgi:hypothetical protein